MPERSLFQSHHDMARSILRTFYEALSSQFDKRLSITRDDVDKAFGLIEDFWPRTLPAFKASCRMCLDKQQPCFNPDARRKDFVTRLLYSRIATEIPERQDPMSGKFFPQVIVKGLQKNVQSMFAEPEYEALNAQVQTIFAMIGTDADTEIWQRVRADETVGMLVDKVFVRFLMRFRQFQHQRQIFMRNIVCAIEPKTYEFTDGDFCTIFDCLFGRFFEAARSTTERIRMDLLFGEETSDSVLKIHSAYDRFAADTKIQAARQKALEPRRRRGTALAAAS